MRQFNKIAIIGVGLIGGSIGLAVKKRRLAKEVVGLFRHRSTLKRAMRYKVIDSGTMDLREGVKDADLVIIATPVYTIPKIFRKIVKKVKKGAIITDAGSTKSWIQNNIEKELRGTDAVYYIGSHPMAGSEHAGAEFARSDLFENSPCVVTKTKKSSKDALAKVVNFWRSLGAKVDVMTPAEHDRKVSFVSHLVHIIAFALAGASPCNEMRYAAEGFRDTTRVASSDPRLWADIFLTNKKAILKSARMFDRHYKKMMNVLSEQRYSKLVSLLELAKAKRDRLVYGEKE